MLLEVDYAKNYASIMYQCLIWNNIRWKTARGQTSTWVCSHGEESGVGDGPHVVSSELKVSFLIENYLFRL